MSQQPEQHTVTLGEIVAPLAVRADSGRSVDSNVIPPPAPAGYTVYTDQELKATAWLPGDKHPSFFMIDGWRYVRLEDVVDSIPTRAERGARLYRCPSEEDTPLAIILHQALVRQYEYTGEHEGDLRALRMYLNRFERALGSLEAFAPSKRNDVVEKWNMRQQICIARDSLVEEIEALCREIDDHDEDAYMGFDEFDMGLPRLPKRRPKGYVWICKI